MLSLNPTVQALMAGNAVVLKPSEVTPLLGRARRGAVPRGGPARGRVPVPCSATARPARALVEAGVDKISFTGSVRTGRKVAEACGRQPDPLHARARRQGPDDRLRGRRPRARRGRRRVRRLRQRRARCASRPSASTWSDEVADEFVRQVVEKTGELRQGSDGEADVGPMIQAAAARDRGAPRRRRRGARRAGAAPAAAATPRRRACSSSPRCWSTSTTTWRSCARRPSARCSRSCACATRTRRCASPTTRATA